MKLFLPKREELIHAEPGGQPSHIFYPLRAADVTTPGLRIHRVERGEKHRECRVERVVIVRSEGEVRDFLLPSLTRLGCGKPSDSVGHPFPFLDP